MNNVLLPRSRARLRALLHKPSVLIFDYDGTLAPIAKRPTKACLPDSTAELLRKLCRIHRCALLTGRSRPDILDKVAAVPFAQVVGNHGAEWAPPLRKFKKERDLVKKWLKYLDDRLASIPGLSVESKKLSISVHFRNVRPLTPYFSEIRSAVEALPRARVIHGKRVYNVLPLTLPDKGTAVKKLMRDYRVDRALYIGDDRTDEDVFALRDPRVFGVHVGQNHWTAARYFIPQQRQVNRFLRLLIELSRPTRGKKMGL